MAKWIFLVYTDCKDPSREAEFNDWYDNVHVPDVMQFPEFLSAVRYVNDDPEAGPGKFLAIYEMEGDDIKQTMASVRERLNKLKEAGRYSDLLVRVSATTYQKM